nr:hypothetical protein [Tanacetum cinerariifolium]
MENLDFFSNLLFDLDEEIISTENHCLIEILRSILLLRLILFLMSSPVNSFFSNQFHRELMKSNLIRRGIFLLSRDCFIWKILSSLSLHPIPIEDSDSLREEIDLFLTPDDSMPPGIENNDYDSEGDIIFLKELLSNDSPSLLENESFHFDVPSSPHPPAKPPDDDGIFFDDEPDTGLLTAKVAGLPRILETRARGFVLRLLDLHILSFIVGIQYPNLID